MRASIALLILAWLPLCHAGWWENWNIVLPLEGGLLAAGEGHLAWLEEGAGLRELGLPAGVRACAPDGSGGAWVLDGGGSWHQLRDGTWQALWSEGRPPLLAGAAGRPARFAVYDGRHLACYEARERPVLLWEVVPGLVSIAGVQVDPVGAAPWILSGQSLYRVDADGLAEERPLALRPVEWRIHRGRPFLLDSGRHLVDAAGVGLLPPGERVRSLFAEASGLRALCVSGRIFRFVGALPVEEEPVGAQEHEVADWIGESLRVFHGPRHRRLHHSHPAARPRRRLDHGGILLQRMPRGGVDWLLEQSGSLRRREGPHSLELGRWEGARSLHAAGPGPILVCDEGLQGFFWSGEPAGWTPEGGLCAWSLEDWLLLGSSEGLRVYWTEEEELQEEFRETSGAIEEIAASAHWGVLRRAQQLELWELSLPWLPRRVDTMPDEGGPILVLEDRLLLGGEGSLRALRLTEDGFRDAEQAFVRYPALSWCRRGADRLLSLDSAGRLRQLRLQDNLPRRIDWELRVDLVGRLELRQEGAQILGKGGVIQVDLRPLAPDLAGPSPRPAQGLAERVGSVPGSTERIRLYDLLGRRLGEWPASRLRRAGLARGRYLALRLTEDGAPISAEPFLVLP